MSTHVRHYCVEVPMRDARRNFMQPTPGEFPDKKRKEDTYLLLKVQAALNFQWVPEQPGNSFLA